MLFKKKKKEYQNTFAKNILGGGVVVFVFLHIIKLGNLCTHNKVCTDLKKVSAFPSCYLYL